MRNNIRRICSGVRCAIVMRSSEPNKMTAIKKLKQDIRNAGRHVLGLHDLCSTDFCKNKEKDTDITKSNDNKMENSNNDEEDIIISQCEYWTDSVKKYSESEIEMLRKGGKTISPKNFNIEELLRDIFLFLNRLSEKANRLIGNFTSNLAESWMSIKCKFEGGKMFNKCFRGSFYARCYGGALRSLLGPAWSPQVYNQLTGKRPDRVFINTYRQRFVRYRCTKRAKGSEINRNKRKLKKMKASVESSSKKARKEYGETVLQDTADISPSQLKKECDTFYKSTISTCNSKLIEQHTRGQSSNINWFAERKKRLTSSVFGEVMSRSQNNNRPNLVKRLLYSNFKGNMYTLKGLSEEDNARIEYINLKEKEENLKYKIDIPGLIVDKLNPYLAASSDGVVVGSKGPEGLIEIKTLLQNKKAMIKESAENDKAFCLSVQNGIIQLKKNHKYFYQIQGQMNIMNFKWCDLIIRRVNPHDMFIQRIYCDTELWRNVMIPKLKAFYFTHMLPELAVPRHGTLSGIRKPELPWFCGTSCKRSEKKNCKRIEGDKLD
ncbi:uncharacterized protein LOC132727107 [Ruditapes philippinarum]|uniref:uncharacterized protein LOC132727107 n=1 Tax=Ruditapes philippinarum TaxID=129788 RepID=UPI00295BCE9F|nr:uncharacterized protein LOC132727107 [Ruditapes philippinarum]